MKMNFPLIFLLIDSHYMNNPLLHLMIKKFYLISRFFPCTLFIVNQM